MGRGFGALRHRNFRLYWSGQVVSLVGTWMQSVSQPWLVLDLGGSAFQVGTVIALQFAPALLSILRVVGPVIGPMLLEWTLSAIGRELEHPAPAVVG